MLFDVGNLPLDRVRFVLRFWFLLCGFGNVDPAVSVFGFRFGVQSHLVVSTLAFDDWVSVVNRILLVLGPL